MNLTFRQQLHILLTRIGSWEYWPFGIIQAPLFLQWLWYALRTGSLFYFSASNPSIPTGGMLGESKADVLDLIPEELKPVTRRIRMPASIEDALTVMQEAGIGFPCVFKPDIGERGWLVRIVQDETEAAGYLADVPCDFLIQEYVSLPAEFGVFYVRFPDEDRGRVVSVTGKRMLTITGDGRTAIGDLIYRDPRARLQLMRLHGLFGHRWTDVLPRGEALMLNPIGNHCLGTCFLDAGHLIGPELEQSFDRISLNIPGFFFGRFDLRCASEQELIQGRVKILELNGCGAEPAHIYQPGFPLRRALTTLMRHMHDMYEVSRRNHRAGVPYLSLREGLRIFRQARTIMKTRMS